MNAKVVKNLENYFRSEDLALLSDVVFTEININSKKMGGEFKILSKNKNIFTFLNTSMNIKEGDVIFSVTDYVHILFKLLKNKNINNLTLITHQSDKKINKRLYKKKPKSIKRWFSVNVNYKVEDLIPIPIGIANHFYNKNLNPNNFSVELKKKKINKIYLNFNPNTNYLLRSKLIKKYKNNIEFIYRDYASTHEQYIRDLQNIKFVLCPEGNGIETHRFWEALQYKAIPITQKKLTNENYRNINAIFLDDLNNIEIKNLDYQINKQNITYKKLFLDFTNLIFHNKSESSTNEVICNTSNYLIFKLKFFLYIKKYFNKLYKPIKIKLLKFFSLLIFYLFS